MTAAQWLAHRTPGGSVHLFGSRFCWMRMNRRVQFIVRLHGWKHYWSFGFGRRD